MSKYRVVHITESGTIQNQDYLDLKALLGVYEQVATEEDSYTICLHGEPILKGLIGPLSEGKHMVRYETPEAFAALTEEWKKLRQHGRKRKSSSS